MRSLVVAILIVTAATACGGHGSAAHDAAATTTTSATATATQARCRAYRSLADLDARIRRRVTQLADDWPQLQTEMAVAFARNEILYRSVALAASGRLRDDAGLVAGFMPRSSAGLLKSGSFLAYRRAVAQAPGVAAVRVAASHLNADAASTCGIQVVPAPPPSTSSL